MAGLGVSGRPRLLTCYLCGREYGSKSLVGRCRLTVSNPVLKVVRAHGFSA
jgi:hypothetical protein